ncbi:hypothetical protein F5Y19DRAFT_145637 [Xylariaceae sp. FL1651]|nr:hypothetical protein F5Y19DRAFT_145637 [Xylariaceae sp. FL1651]
MLTTRTVPRSRPLQTRTVANNVFGSNVTSSLQPRHCLQTRAFRFGMWSSCLDPAFHRELRRRHRMLKHKYADAINRRLSWHEHPLAEEPGIALKRAVTRYWGPTAARYSSRWVNQDELDGRRDRPDRPSCGVDDHSRHTSFSFDTEPPRHDSWKSHVDQVINRWSRQTPRDINTRGETEMNSQPSHIGNSSRKPKSQKKDKQERTPSVEEDYVIDPITNRKVPKTQHGSAETDLEPPVQTFKSYRSQFAPFSPPTSAEERPPIHSNGKPPAAELSKYAESKFDDWPAAATYSSTNHTKPISRPEAASHVFDNAALKSEEYSLNHLPLEEEEECEDLHKYEGAVSETTLEKSLGSSGHSSDADSHSVSTFGPSSRAVSESHQLQSELQKYEPYMYNENVPEQASPDRPQDLEKYESFGHGERTITDHSESYVSRGSELPIESSATHDELQKYRPTVFDDINGQDPPFEQYGDLEKYKSFRFQDPDTVIASERDVVTGSLRDFDIEEHNKNLSDTSSNASLDWPGKLPTMELPEGHVFAKHYSNEPGMHSSQCPGDIGQSREELNYRMGKLSEASDAVDREINSNLQKARQSFLENRSADSHRPLTGNFVKDFPEEFSGSWDAHEGELRAVGNRSKALDSSCDQSTQSEIQQTEKEYSENLSNATNTSFLEPALDRHHNSSRLEPALNRRTSAIKGNHLNHAFRADLYSKKPQGLETSFTEECGKQTMPIYTRAYGSEPGQVAVKSESAKESEAQELAESSSQAYYHRDPEIDGLPPSISAERAGDQKSTPLEDPIIYKILAYDPTMQTISIAETTSVVPDQASPLSPTEVLPRLSNPKKFFPHFAPLQAEGFEIVSGSGDVLVFRQVRPARTVAKGGATPINPIDMMGRPTVFPSAAAFVSPTGFINYDIPRVEESTEPAFRSNIDVRREEPVFSGPRSSSDDRTHKKPKMRLGKRVLIGGAWVAGVSYALGVVSEYFTTGGIDGKGPTGFSPS